MSAPIVISIIADTRRALGGIKNTVTALGGLAAVGFGAAIKSAADFQQQMADISAVSGATAGEMKLLSDKALEIGANTAFSASQGAEAMEELIKAGVSTKDVLGGAADAAVAMAAASGIPIAEAATIASDAMNQFGLDAKDLPEIADLFAGAANASSIGMSDLGQSMGQAGAVAKLLGVPIKDATVAIAELGNAGIKGSDAGTSLKTFMSSLVPNSKQAKDAMKDLGLITKEGGNQFFDAKGKIKDFSDIQGILAKSLDGLSTAQQTAALKTIFGSDAIRAASVFAKEGKKGFDDMAKSVDKTKATDVAKKRMDSLKGSVEAMKGSAETLGIKLGQVLLPFLKKAADKATEFINALGDKGLPAFERALPKIKTAIEKIGDAFKKAFDILTNPLIQAAIGGIVAGLAVYKTYVIVTGAWAAATGGLAAAWAGLTAIMAANPFVIVAAAVIGIVTALVILYKRSQKAREIMSIAFSEMAKAILTVFVKPVLIGMKLFVKYVLGAFNLVLKGASKAFGWVPGIGDDIKKASKGFDDFRDSALDAIDSGIKKTDAWKDNLDKLPKKVALQGDIKDIDEKIKDAKKKLANPKLTQPQRIRLKGDIKDLHDKLNTAKAELAHLQGKTIKVNIVTTRTNRNGSSPSGDDVIRSQATDMAKGIAAYGSAVTASAVRAAGAAAGSAAKVFSEAVQRAVDTSTLSGLADTVAKELLKSFTGSPDDIANAATSMAGNLQSAYLQYQDQLASLNDGIKDAAAGRREAYSALGSAERQGTKDVAAAKKEAAANLKAANQKVDEAEERLAHARKTKGSRDDFNAALSLKHAEQSRTKTVAKGKAALAKARAAARKSRRDAQADVKEAETGLGSLQQQLLYLQQAFSGISSPAKVRAAQTALLEFSKTMNGIALQRADIAVKLEAANKSLDDAMGLRDGAIEQYRNQALEFAKATSIEASEIVTSTENVLDAFGRVTGTITKTSGGTVDVQAGLRTRLDAIRSFTANVKQLAMQGLSQDLLKQLLDAGPDAGAAYAQAILSGGAQGISEMNDLQSQIRSAADELGTFGGTTLYQSGVDSAQGLVDGLKSQDAQLKQTALSLAQSFQSSFLQGLKIPKAALDVVTQYFTDLAGSQLGAQVGAQTGINGEKTAVNKPVMQVTIQGAIDPVSTGRQVVAAVAAYEKANGKVYARA